MKALTLHQPWATLVVEGVKTIETRSWSTSYRGPLAVHAGLTQPTVGGRVGDYRISRDRTPTDAPWTLWADAPNLRHTCVAMPLGAVVGFARLVDCVRTERIDWVPGRIAAPDGDPLDWVRWGSSDSVDARVTASQRVYGDYAPGRWAWLLADVIAFGPFPARGKQGLWEWDES